MSKLVTLSILISFDIESSLIKRVSIGNVPSEKTSSVSQFSMMPNVVTGTQWVLSNKYLQMQAMIRGKKIS